MLTNAAVKAARPKSAAYKLADERGLHLFVATNGRKSFRWRFRWDGREQLLTIGAWPEISLDVARARVQLAREQLGRGEDPRCRTCAHAQTLNFEAIGRRWHAHMAPRWTPVYAGDVLASLERDVFPAIGAMPIGAITVPVVLGALRVIEARGSLETARRVRQRLSAVFSFAIAEGLVDQDPAAIVGRALMPPAPARHHPALLDIARARTDRLGRAGRRRAGDKTCVEVSRANGGATGGAPRRVLGGDRRSRRRRADMAGAGRADETCCGEEARCSERPSRAAIAAGGAGAARRAGAERV